MSWRESIEQCVRNGDIARQARDRPHRRGARARRRRSATRARATSRSAGAKWTSWPGCATDSRRSTGTTSRLAIGPAARGDRRAASPRFVRRCRLPQGRLEHRRGTRRRRSRHRGRSRSRVGRSRTFPVVPGGRAVRVRPARLPGHRRGHRCAARRPRAGIPADCARARRPRCPISSIAWSAGDPAAPRRPGRRRCRGSRRPSRSWRRPLDPRVVVIGGHWARLVDSIGRGVRRQPRRSSSRSARPSRPRSSRARSAADAGLRGAIEAAQHRLLERSDGAN